MLSLKQLYLSKREIREAETELLMSECADKKEGTYLAAVSIPISLARSKSAADSVNIEITQRPEQYPGHSAKSRSSKLLKKLE